MNWVYAGIIVLVLLVGIPALWLAFSNPKFVYGLFTQAASALFNALLPVLLKRMPPDEEEAWNKFKRSNPSNEEIRRWQRDYVKRRKARK